MESGSMRQLTEVNTRNLLIMLQLAKHKIKLSKTMKEIFRKETMKES
jgi:hypothetical protein